MELLAEGEGVSASSFRALREEAGDLAEDFDRELARDLGVAGLAARDERRVAGIVCEHVKSKVSQE